MDKKKKIKNRTKNVEKLLTTHLFDKHLYNFNLLVKKHPKRNCIKTLWVLPVYVYLCFLLYKAISPSCSLDISHLSSFLSFSQLALSYKIHMMPQSNRWSSRVYLEEQVDSSTHIEEDSYIKNQKHGLSNSLFVVLCYIQYNQNCLHVLIFMYVYSN